MRRVKAIAQINLIHQLRWSPFPPREGYGLTPELKFIKDGSIEHGAKIAKFLEQINAESKGNSAD